MSGKKNIAFKVIEFRTSDPNTENHSILGTRLDNGDPIEARLGFFKPKEPKLKGDGSPETVRERPGIKDRMTGKNAVYPGGVFVLEDAVPIAGLPNGFSGRWLSAVVHTTDEKQLMKRGVDEEVALCGMIALNHTKSGRIYATYLNQKTAQIISTPGDLQALVTDYFSKRPPTGSPLLNLQIAKTEERASRFPLQLFAPWESIGTPAAVTAVLEGKNYAQALVNLKNGPLQVTPGLQLNIGRDTQEVFFDLSKTKPPIPRFLLDLEKKQSNDIHPSKGFTEATIALQRTNDKPLFIVGVYPVNSFPTLHQMVTHDVVIAPEEFDKMPPPDLDDEGLMGFADDEDEFSGAAMM